MPAGAFPTKADRSFSIRTSMNPWNLEAAGLKMVAKLRSISFSLAGSTERCVRSENLNEPRTPENVARLMAALDEMDTIFRDFSGRRIRPTESYLVTANPKLLLTQHGPLEKPGATPAALTPSNPRKRILIMRRVLPVLLLTLIALPCGITTTRAQDEQSKTDDASTYIPPGPRKSVEVGDFYFKRNNYRAAESRYAEALEYMPHHAEATYKLAESQEKLGKPAEARANYEKYLKILPRGPFAELAKKALARLDTQAKETTSPPAQKRP